jgi:hypothetical protein
MLYTSPIDSITWNAVEEFCAQGIAEGTYLDYKRDFPTELARTIAAMANTLGGVILIGVEEGVDGKPKMPLVGVPLDRGLAERVTNIVLTNITPPVFPEVAVCSDASKTKAILVIRVPQSPETPHAIRQNTRVYLRTENRNNPEELATLDQVEWLQSKRTRSIALRDHLFTEAIQRSDILFGQVVRSQGVRKQAFGEPPANLMLRVVPQFPGQQFKSPPELRSVLRNIQVRDYYGTDDVFPLGGSNAVLLQNGAYVGTILDAVTGKRSYYTELSVFGQLFYRQTLVTKMGEQNLIRASELFCRLDEFTTSSKKFFEQIGYQGFVLLSCSIYGAHSMPLGQWGPEERGLPISTCPDESIGYESSFLVSDWENESHRAVLAAARTIGWAYNWDISDSLVDRYYATNRKAQHYR